jgi:hypothetical protein
MGISPIHESNIGLIPIFFPVPGFPAPDFPQEWGRIDDGE